MSHPTRDDIDLLEGSFYVDAKESYAWLRTNAPVYFDSRTGIWGFASYDAVLTAEKDPQPCMMIDMDDAEHWQRRKLVNKGFTPRRVRESEDAIRAACDVIIDGVCE